MSTPLLKNSRSCDFLNLRVLNDVDKFRATQGHPSSSNVALTPRLLRPDSTLVSVSFFVAPRNRAVASVDVSVS
jgi:hypothetical protein